MLWVTNFFLNFFFSDFSCCIYFLKMFDKGIFGKKGHGKFLIIWNERWSLHLFLTTAPQQTDVAGNILLFCYKKKRKEKK
jgi:hypothetical protein